MAADAPRMTRCGVMLWNPSGMARTPFLPFFIASLLQGGLSLPPPLAGPLSGYGIDPGPGQGEVGSRETDAVDRGQVLAQALPVVALVVGHPARAGRAAERQRAAAAVHVEGVAVSQV